MTLIGRGSTLPLDGTTEQLFLVEGSADPDVPNGLHRWHAATGAWVFVG